MLENYLRTAARHLARGRLFAVINITGLAVGLAAVVLIALYVQGETGYDKHWVDGDRIYRVNTTLDSTGGSPSRVSAASISALPALERFFGEEIEIGARTISRSYEARTGGERFFNEVITEVDPTLLDIFEFEVDAGSLEDTLDDPTSIALSAEVAARLFPAGEALDRTITLLSSEGVTRDLRVGAIYRLADGNTVLDLPAMSRLELASYPYLFNWLILSGSTWVKLAPGTDVDAVHSRMAAFVDQNVDISAMMAGPGVRPSDRVGFDLQQIADTYLYSPGSDGGNATMVFAFSGIAVLVLLIGCINFSILATAKATQRAREVALRKVIGASRGQLIVQFLGESFLLASLALLLALAIVEVSLPFFESIVNESLAVSYADPLTWVALLALLAVVGLMSGLYPAFVLSHFRPAGALRTTQSAETKGSSSVRRVLVTVQFGVSIALMIATIAIYAQVQFVLSRDPGFNAENLLLVENLLNVDSPWSSGGSGARKETLRREVASLPDVSSVGLSMHRPTQAVGLSTIIMPFTLQGGPGAAQQIAVLGIDDGFFETYRIPVIAGRPFSRARDRSSRIFPSRADREQAPIPEAGTANAVINASAARQLGFSSAAEAIGRQIRSGNSAFTGAEETLTIVGVVGDTQFFSLRREPRPEIYVVAPDFADVMTVRFQGDPRAILARIDARWRAWSGGEPLVSSFVEQNLLEELDRERTEARVLVSFALLAILVACLGLLGSASFTVDRRTKEIGVRKVFGAEIGEVVGLLLWQFSRPVIVANLLAWPASLWALTQWLERFPYRIDAWTLGSICLAAGLIALTVAGLTVAVGTVRAASANPIHSLRYE